MLIKPSISYHSRRDFLRAGMYGLGVSAGLPLFLQHVSAAQADGLLNGFDEKHPNRILVVLELTGGCDGLNTVVPWSDDAYYKARPTLAIKPTEALKLNDRFGFHPAMTSMEALFKDGRLAVVHGCGYPNPNLSHFTAMDWWHTAAPHANEATGWLGRFADSHKSHPAENYIVNITTKQSRAVASNKQSPVVFKDPRKFGRTGTDAQQPAFEKFGTVYPTSNSTLDYLNQVSRTATAGAALVRNACAEYRTMVDYGSNNDLTLDLKKVAGMIKANLPTRIFYVNQAGYDTHAAQAGSQQTLLIYFADALRGFMEDLQRIGRADDVAIMVFTEFGRRVNENLSKGTDHGTATPMYVIGKKIKGGFYGKMPSLTNLDDGNLKMTTDFRSVYATMLKEWMGFDDTKAVLKGDYPALGVFG
ncbi:MAG: DUF1501 domain-containing protein [Acidobacteriota bacterium]|nr:DUF1501 domain-containing protein [Acidobacteriota bacterium]